MGVKRKLRIYKTREITKGLYVTEILNSPRLLDSCRFFSSRLEIKDVDYNDEKFSLELFLISENLLFNYALFENAPIISFLEDMKVPKNLDSQKAIQKLKGKTLDGILNDFGEIVALWPIIYERELNQGLMNKLKQEIKQRKKEYEILKINKKLSQEDYALANELKKYGLLNLPRDR